LAAAAVLAAILVATAIAVPVARRLSYGETDPEDTRPDSVIVGFVGAALIFWPWCLAAVVSVVVDLDHSEDGYYAAVAQLIPVLFIALLFSAGVLRSPGRRPDPDSEDSPRIERYVRAVEWAGWLATIFLWQAVLGEGAALYGAALGVKSTFLVAGTAAVVLTQLLALGETALLVYWTVTGGVVEHGVEVLASPSAQPSGRSIVSMVIPRPAREKREPEADARPEADDQPGNARD
jgi:hypothetical protein